MSVARPCSSLSMCLLPRWAGAAPAFTTTEVAQIQARQGVQRRPRKPGRIANIGFVIGDRSVAVIDPGGSRTDGEGLRARLRTVTDRPISHVIMTHLHPDHVFGACAFEQDQPVFARMPEWRRCR